MNQKLLKKLPRYCAAALICAMMSAASALAFNEIPSPGNLTGSGTIGGNSLKVSASSASAVVVGGESNTASGLYSVAIGGISNSAFWRGSVAVGGYENNASGLYSVAVGGLTNTVGYVSVAVGGYENNASGFYSVAVGGRTNTVSGYHSVVVGGRSNSASSNYSVAIGGYMNTASEDSSLAAGGLHNTASGNWSAAFGGSMNTASGGHSVAVGGQLNSASGDGSAAFGGARNTAFGYWAATFGGEYNIASGESSATLGGKSGDASGKYSVAVGGLYNTASAQYSAALGGAGNTAKGKNSVVIGGGIGDGYGGVPVSGDNTASGPGSVILGGTNNVTTAAASQSVVVGGKGGQASEEYAAVLGGLRNAASGKNSVATGGFYNLAYGTNSAVFGGSGNFAYGTNSAVFGGQNNTASGDNSAVLGGINNTADGERSAAVGGNVNKATGDVSAAVGGFLNTASGFRSTAVGGYLNTASGVESVTLGGEGGQAAEEYAVAIGGGQANAKNSVAIGNGVKTSTTQYEVAIGNSDANKLTFTGANIAASGQKITNVAAGMNDSDVVVVSQLKKVSSDAKLYTDKKAAEALTAANNYTDTEVKKAITASTYTGTENIEVDNDKRTIALKDNVKLTDAGSLKVGEKTTVNNKGVLYTAADGEKVLLGEDAGGTKGVYVTDTAKSKNSALTADTLKVGSKTYIDDNGVNANDRKITNVAAGEADTDAVNVAQLKAAQKGAAVLGSENITVTPTADGQKVSLKDNVQLTKNGTVTIGTEADDRQMLIGAETPIGTKGIINRAKTDDGKVNYTEIDSKEFIAQVIEDGEVKQASRLDSAVLEFADAATPGQQKITGLTVDRLGIAVSQDGKVSYGTGLTAEGIVVNDKSTEGVTEVSAMGKQGFVTTYGSNGSTIDKAAFVTTGGEYDSEYGKLKFDAGLYVADKTNGEIEISSLTLDKLTVANKTYIDEKGVNANDRKIRNVAEGTTATDAANVGQLITVSAGGNVTLNETTNANGSKNYEISAVGTGFLEGGDNINVTDGKINLDDNIKLTKDGSIEIDGKKYVSAAGINANGQKITNVADGSIAQNSKDAVNGGQLWNAYDRINELDNDLSGVGSAAAAMSALQAIPYNPYAPTTVTAGLGFYRSDQAVAVGIYHYIRDSVLVNVGGAFNLNGHGDAMGRAGISFALGKGAGKGSQSIGRNVTELQNTVASLRSEVETLRAESKEDKRIIQEKDEETKRIVAEKDNEIKEIKKMIEEKDKETKRLIEELKKAVDKKK